MGDRFYRAGNLVTRFIKTQCAKDLVLHRQRGVREGGYLIACTHVSHMEPFIVSAMVPRVIHWMARKEFYKYRFSSFLLDAANAFCVNRQGVPVSAIRRGIDLARQGRCVGIFPEGGVKKKDQTVFRGGPMKLGACVVAQRAQVPIVPVVMLGTNALTRVESWLPARRTKLYIAFGEAIPPPAPDAPRRAARFETGERLQRAFIELYQELLVAGGLSDEDVP